MEAKVMIDTWILYFETYIKKELYALLSSDKKYIIVNFIDIMQVSPELAQDILDSPYNTCKGAEIAIDNLIGQKNIHIRIINAPESCKISISELRSKNLNRFISIEGYIRQKSDVRPIVTMIKFECPSCGNIAHVLQLEDNIKEPDKCSCGRKGKFTQLSKTMVDGQAMVIEEPTDDLENGEQPKRLNIFLTEDLVSPITEKRKNPGMRVKVCGILKEVLVNKQGGKSTQYDIKLDVNNIEPIEETFIDLKIDEEEIKEIIELSRKPDVLDILVRSVAPSIHGHDTIKEALILQLFGGIRKTSKELGIRRGDIHIFLIGAPGVGKSFLLKRLQQVAPKGRFVSGKGTSGTGVTACVVKDEFKIGRAHV